jgi:DNA-directed RNA polymerase specialized sigma24 family protein
MLDESRGHRAAFAPDVPADAGLMDDLTAGRRDALGVLFDRHGGRLLALAEVLVADRPTAEALVHDAFLLAWHQARAFDATRASVPAWLTGRLLDCLKARCTPQQRSQAAQALRALIGQTGGRP